MSGRASLNHVYPTVWNQALGAMVAVAETETSHGRAGNASGAAPGAARRGPRGLPQLGVLALSLALVWGCSAPTWAAGNALPKGGAAVFGREGPSPSPTAMWARAARP